MYPRLKWAVVVVVLGALLLVPGGLTTAADTVQGQSKGQMLDSGRWEPGNRSEIQKLIDKYAGKTNFDNLTSSLPFAVFDWDDTSVVGDTSLTMFVYQIDHPDFVRLPPPEFAKAVALKDLDEKRTVRNVDGKPVSVRTIAQDLIDDYQWLYDNRDLPLDKLRQTDQFLDFKVKMVIMYGAATPFDLHKPWWSLNFVAGMTTEELQAVARASHEYNLGVSLATVRLISPESMAKKTGVMAVEYQRGLRLVPEIANLMHTLLASGIDVFVVTGSLDDSVRVLATDSRYGYNLDSTHVFGIALARDQDGRYLPKLAEGRVVTVEKGKTITIVTEILEKPYTTDLAKLQGPILVGGDSDGDKDMVKDFRNTEIVVLMNRMQPFAVYEWCLFDGKARCRLQGRNENNGYWLPTSHTLRLTTTADQ